MEKDTVEKDFSDTSTDPDIDPIACEVCQSQTSWAQMLLCDKCDKGYHMGCLVPALFRIPDDEWICPGCQPLMTEETIVNSDAEEQGLDYGQKGAGDILQDDLTMTVLKERHGLPYKEISPPANLEAKQWTRALKRARKRARSYFIEQGNVYKLSKDCSEKPRRVPPAQERYQLIKEVHALGHVGITKCAQLLVWPTVPFSSYMGEKQYYQDSCPTKQNSCGCSP
jgi:hypothetical protein